MNQLTIKDKEAILKTIMQLSEADKNFVLGYAAGVVAKTTQRQEEKSA